MGRTIKRGKREKSMDQLHHWVSKLGGIVQKFDEEIVEKRGDRSKGVSYRKKKKRVLIMTF